MAIINTITKPAIQAPRNEITFTANGENVKLSPDTVKKYLVNGGGAVTDQEVVMFMSLCRYQHLNPFLREAYLVKYGNNSPATMVTGKDVFLKRANRNANFRGMKAGVIVQDENTGEVTEREGTFYLKTEKIVGGFAKVFVEGREPYCATVAFDEYAGRKSSGELNSQWASKPATMIRKVALVQALREAFPEDFSQLYAAEEVGTTDIDETPVAMPQNIASADPQEMKPEPKAEPQKNEQLSFAESANPEDIFFE